MSANEKQVGGEHYKSKIQHWDYVVANDLDYFQAQITKYVTRWKKKNGLIDLEKALHFLEKYIELEEDRRLKEKDNPYKYPDDYKEQLAVKMSKMREDAMTGIPEHLRAEMIRKQNVEIKKQFESADIPSGPLINNYVSPMLAKFWGGEEPQSQGYVNQDGPDV